jgi:hypothetical protein
MIYEGSMQCPLCTHQCPQKEMTLETWELISLENIWITSAKNTQIKVYSMYTVVVGTLLKAAHLAI